MTIRLCLMLTTLLIVPGIASAQVPPTGTGTYTGTAVLDVPNRYTFATTAPGQLTATLSWDNQAATLMLILVCSSPAASDPLTFAVAAGLLDRTARFEAGILGELTCLLQVGSLDLTAAYRLNVQMSTDQLATPSAPLRVSASRDAGVERRLREHAAATARALQVRPR